MCTAVTFTRRDFYFGRTLDLEGTFGEEVVITPRNFPLPFKRKPTLQNHYAIIGMAHVSQGYPLYYDAVNEKGLCMAGLNFPGFCRYHSPSEDRDNIASFEFIPWILGQCANMEEARKLLPRLCLIADPFSRDLPATPLHWMIADSSSCIVVESMAGGIRIYENPVGVLTNNPPFDDQMLQLCNFMHLSPHPPHNHFSPDLALKPYSRGMGAMGLPGDLSSQSRFVRVAFVKLNSVSGQSEEESISQFFHILGAVDQQRGCCEVGEGGYEITIYTSCCNATKGIYYYTTYQNHQITAVDMHQENLDGSNLIRYPLMTGEHIYRQN